MSTPARTDALDRTIAFVSAPLRSLRSLRPLLAAGQVAVRGALAPRRLPAYYHVDRLMPWLLIGPALREQDYSLLTERGVTHVLDLRSEGGDQPEALAALGLHWRQVRVHDREAPTNEQFEDISNWIDREVRPEGVLYLHCEGGLGRTPTVAMALLMRRGFLLGEANRMVMAVRPEAAPTGAQRRWLEALASEPPHLLRQQSV